MRVVLTGATGLIGRQVVTQLVQCGAEVHAMSRQRPEQLPASAVWHRIDLLDSISTGRLLGELRASHMLHCAWCMEPGQVWWDPANLDWCGATLRIVRRFVEAGGSRLVAVGTCAEYDWSDGMCDEETTLRRPATLYGVAKDACHRVLAAYARPAGLTMSWARLFNMYGPHEHPRRLVGAAIAALRRNEIFACTDGRQLRDFMHVSDVAAALICLLRGNSEGPVNIGSGVRIKVRDVLEEIARQLDRPDLLRFGALPRPEGDPDMLLPALARMNAALSWQPRFGLRDGIADTVAWWHRQAGGQN